jgi:hypothetical protein
MQDKTISEKEGFLIIQQMIQATKTKLSDDGFMYLLWGWLVLAASVLEFVLLRVGYPFHFITWAVLMPLGAVVSIFYGYRKSKTETVKTYLDGFMAYLWGAFGVALLIVLTFMGRTGLENAYPMVLVLYGIATFVSGGALRFRPLIVGGVCCWILAVTAMFLTFQFQLLALAAAVLVAYVIPGHMLRHQYKHGVQGA